MTTNTDQTAPNGSHEQTQLDKSDIPSVMPISPDSSRSHSTQPAIQIPQTSFEQPTQLNIEDNQTSPALNDTVNDDTNPIPIQAQSEKCDILSNTEVNLPQTELQRPEIPVDNQALPSENTGGESEHQPDDSAIPPEAEPEIPVSYEDLSEREKDFLKVFAEGDYVKNDSFLPIEVSEMFFIQICPNTSHAKYLKKRLPSLMKLTDPLFVIPKRPQSELSNNYPIPYQDVKNEVEFKVQATSCQRYSKDVPRCCHCITKQTDNCRFKGIREIATKLDDSNAVVLTPPRWQKYPSSDDLIDYPLMTIPNKARTKRGRVHEPLNDVLEFYKAANAEFSPIEVEPRDELSRTEKENFAKYILNNCSTPLKSFLTLQLDLFNNSQLYLKTMSTIGQHQCDLCRSTLLNIYYLGKHCGIEICHECYLTAPSIITGSKCARDFKHTMTDFIPVAIYPKTLFLWLLDNCEKSLKNYIPTPPQVPDELFVYNGEDSAEEVSRKLYKPYPRGTEKEIGLNSYQSLMQQGIPFVVQGISPHHYEQFGADNLSVVYSDDTFTVEKMTGNANKPTPTTLEKFFEGFTTYDEEKKIRYRKIKDWPPYSDFKTCFTNLHHTFLNSLPFKECTHPDGFLNLAKYLPSHLNPPDLGPKMYIATGREKIGLGTTPLHLDAADAVNIMTHSYKSGYEFPNVKCAALWHIFEYKDVEKIRNYLYRWNLKKWHPLDFCDFIHDQTVYLTEEMLRELKDEEGVTSFQIYQNPGDAVFIPAGCSHQVVNLSNCIKIATDFISPERTNQCMRVAHDFRKLPNTHLRNDDIVQTQNHIMFTSSNAISRLLAIDDDLLNSITKKEEPSTPKEKVAIPTYRATRSHSKRKQS